MQRASWVRQAIRAGNELHFRKTPPLRHNLINLAAAAGVLGAVGGVMALGGVLPPALYLPLAVPALGALYFSVFVLIIHECSHNMFLIHSDQERTKRINHWIGIAAAMPLFTDYVNHWEKGHIYHHLHPCEEGDKQHVHTYTGARLWRTLLKLLLIPGYAVTLNPSKGYPGSAKRVAITLVMWAGFIALTGLLISWTVPVAFVLAFNVVQMLNLLKKSQEHGDGLEDEPDPIFRTRTYFNPLRSLGSPFNISYHFEHHLNFSVPWYNLPAYHKLVYALTPAPLRPLLYNHDYIGHLNGKRPRYTEALRAMITTDEAVAT